MRVAHVDVLDAFTYGGGTRLATVRRFATLVAERSIGAQGRLTATLPRTAPGADALVPGRVLRVRYADGSYREWLLVDRTDGAGRTISLTALGFSEACHRCPPVSRTDADGTTTLTYDALGLTPTEHLTTDILPALAAGGLTFVALGTITPTGRVDLQYDGTNPWDALAALQAATDCELDFEWRDDLSQVLLHLVPTVNDGVRGPDLRVGANASIARTLSVTTRRTRIYGLGANGTTVGDAVWVVAAKSGTDLTLADPAGGEGPFLADNQLVGAYLEAADRTTRTAISATVAATQVATVGDASAFSVGDRVRIRAASDGTKLASLEHPTYISDGLFVGEPLRRPDLLEVVNLIPNAGMTVYTSSSAAPDGWSAVGGATVTRNSSAAYRQVGPYSCRVQTSSDGDGLATGLVTLGLTDLSPDVSGFVSFYLVSGTVRVELVATDGVTTWIVPDGVTQVASSTERGTFVSLGVAGIPLHEYGATEARLRIVQHGAGTAEWYTDAAQLTESSGQLDFVDGADPTRLWQAVNAALLTDAPLTGRYEVTVADLFRKDGTAYPLHELILGGTHAVIDGAQGILEGVRILTVQEDLLEPLKTQVTLSSRPQDLLSLVRAQRQVAGQAKVALPGYSTRARTVTDGVATPSDATFGSASAGFTNADVGKTIYVLGAGPDGAVLKTTVASRTSATSIELADAASSAGTGLTAVLGEAGEVLTLAAQIGGGRAGSALLDENGVLAPGVADANGRGVSRFFAKPVTADPDTFDSVTDGSTYVKQIPLLTCSLAEDTTDDTSVTVLVTATDPTGGAAPTIAHDGGAAVTDNGGGSYTIARPASGGPLIVLFTASKTGRESATVGLTVPEQPATPTTGPSLDVKISLSSTTATVTYSYTGTITYSVNGGSYSSPPASPISISRPNLSDQDETITFRCVKDGVTQTNTVIIPRLLLVFPELTVTPGTQTATTQPYTVTATDPTGGWGGTMTLTVTIRGATGSASSSGSISDGTPKTISSGEVITVNRPAFNSDPAMVEFKVANDSGGVDTIQRTVLNQDKTSFGPSLEVQLTEGDTSDTITWDGTGTITVDIDGGGYGTPASSPITVSRNAVGGATKVYTFKAVADGQTVTSVANVLPQLSTGGGTPIPSINALDAGSPNTGADTIALSWTPYNEPGGATYDARVYVRTLDSSGSSILSEETFNVSGVGSSPWSMAMQSDFNIDLVSKGASGWGYCEVLVTLKMMSGGSPVAIGQITINCYGIYNP